MGIYFFWGTVSYLVSALLFVPLDYYQQAQIHPLKEKGYSLLSLLRLNTRIIFFFAIVFVLLLVIVFFINNKYSLYLLVAGLMAITQHIVNSLRGGLNNLGFRQSAALTQLFEVILKVSLLAAFIWGVQGTSLTVMGTNTFALFISIFLLLWLTLQKDFWSGIEVPQPSTRSVILFSWPISIGALVNWGQTQGFRLVLIPMGMSEIVGVFSTINAIGIAGMSVAVATYFKMFIPDIYKSGGQTTPNYLLGGIGLILIIFLISFIVLEPLVSLTTNVSFTPFRWLLLIGVLTEGCNLLIGGIGIHMTILGLTRPLLWCSIAGVFTAFLLLAGLIMGEMISVWTVGIPILASQIIVVVLSYAIWKKSIRHSA